MNDNDRLLALLRQRGERGVTRMEVLDDLSFINLPGRIFDLKARGLEITDEWITVPSGKRVKKYVLVEKPEQLAWTA